MSTHDEAARRAVEKLDLDAKTRLLAGQDMWTLPAIPEIGLSSLVMSDGPIGVRGVRWTPQDPSIALPSPTALAATWDVDLARRAGNLLAQEARRKGVHVLLAPTVNLHRSPLGGRHFECYSEDPHLTARIGKNYVAGVQEGGVGTTVKHFVANDAETDRFTVDNIIDARTLHDLYLAPFEEIVKDARPWGVMSAYNSVNGLSMTEHHHLQTEVLRGEWGFDGVIVSDWTAARSTVTDILAGLDIAMPGPHTVYGSALADAVRAGDVSESVVDKAAGNVLRLAARVGVLEGAEPAVNVNTARATPDIDGRGLTREIAHRSFVLLRNKNHALPLDADAQQDVALIGPAADDIRILGGGSAEVAPDRVVSPLDGLRETLPDAAVRHCTGTEVDHELSAADRGFTLHATCRDREGHVLARVPLPNGMVLWHNGDLPEGVDFDDLHEIEITGTFTPDRGGSHTFGTKGVGAFRLAVGGRELFDGIATLPADTDPVEALLGAPSERGEIELTAGEPVEMDLHYTLPTDGGGGPRIVSFSLAHRRPRLDPHVLMEEAVRSARSASIAVVVVGTTERVESEGFDRDSLRLPGEQDELVRRVAAVNDRTVVVVNAGAPVEMPWRDDVAAVLLGWFPGQEGGYALADVLVGNQEPGGRLPTTWPARLDDAPVSRVAPINGRLPYEEGSFIGYRAWERSGTAPAYCFGHGLGYTRWSYEAVSHTPVRDADSLGEITVRIRNTGDRAGREVIQIYLATPEDDPVSRPHRQLAAFATVSAPAGDSVEATVSLPHRAAEIRDDHMEHRRLIPGTYTAEIGHSFDDVRLTTHVRVGE